MTIAPEVPVGLAVIAAMVVLTWVLILEHRRARPDALRMSRVVASILVVLALLALVLRPGGRGSAEGWALVVTDDVGAGQLASVLADDGPAAAFRLAGTRTPDADPGAGAWQTVPDLATLRRGWPQLRRWRIVGHGLTPARARVWAQDPDRPQVETVVAPPPTAGIESIAWPRRVRLGEEVVVRGRVSAATPAGTLRLLDAGGVVDETTITAEDEARRFTLRVRLPVVGRHPLVLRHEVTADEGEATDGEPAGVVIEETLGVEVTGPATPAVSWLSAAPSFEVRPLRRWLVAQGGALVVRSGLTDARRRTTLAGAGAETLVEGGLDRLTVETLGRFDLLVLDPETLRGFGGAERRALDDAVRDHGLGVLVLIDEGDPRRGGRATEPADPWWPAWRPIDDIERLEARIRWPGGHSDLALSLPPRVLAEGRGIVPLATDQAGRLLAALQPRGHGVVAWSLVSGTHRWALAGEGTTHQAFWSHLFGQIARPPATPLRWQAPVGPMRVDEPQTLFLDDTRAPEARSTPMIVVTGPVEALSLVARPVEGGWSVDWWPRQSGWHEVAVAGHDDAASRLAIDIAPADAWRTWHQAERRHATESLARLPTPATEGADAPFVPWSRGWAFAAWLLATAFLWLDERRST